MSKNSKIPTNKEESQAKKNEEQAAAAENKPVETMELDEINNDTGQTGQRTAYIEVKKTEDGWVWTLYAINGRPLAISAIDYARRNDATKAIIAFRDAMKLGPKVFILHDDEE